MNTKFNSKKMLAAAAYVCQSNNGKYDKLALIKVLYIAERESICETFHVMTGDEMLKYTYGPVLKRLHDVLRGKATLGFQSEWDKHFKNPVKETSKDQNVRLKTLPDMDELSYADKLFLDKGISFVNNCKRGKLVGEVHDFHEWEIAKNSGSAKIDVVDILNTYRSDLSQAEVMEIKAEL